MVDGRILMVKRVLAASAAGLVLVAGAGTAAVAAPVPAAAKYSSCKKLNAKYPGGVAKSSSVRNTKTVNGKLVPAVSQFRPKVSAALYKANRGLDRDRDGIACER